MQTNVMVIGNGYDLAHGLKTKYSHLIEFIKKVENQDNSLMIDEKDHEFICDCIENNGFINYFLKYENNVPGWVDLERLLNEVTHYFEVFFNNYTHFIDSKGNILWNMIENDMGKNNMMKTINCLFMFNLFDKDHSRANYICKHLDKKYYSDLFGLNKREILNLLKEQLDEVIRLLQLYLKKYIYENETDIKKINQIQSINPFYVISFNYTDTYKRYGIKEEDVFYIHGSLDKDNMVLGYDDDQSDDLDFIYFKKYFQRIQKMTGYIDTNKIQTYNEFGEVMYATIHFYGHSMDKTDGDIIREIYDLAGGFVIYYYDQLDYEQKVINLIDVFGKKQALELIQTKWIKFVQCET